MAISWKVNRIT